MAVMAGGGGSGGGGGDDVALRAPSSDDSDQLQLRDVALLATRAAMALLISLAASASAVRFAALALSAQPGQASVQRATTAVALPAPESGWPAMGTKSKVRAGAAALKFARHTEAAPTARGASFSTFHW